MLETYSSCRQDLSIVVPNRSDQAGDATVPSQRPLTDAVSLVGGCCGLSARAVGSKVPQPPLPQRKKSRGTHEASKYEIIQKLQNSTIIYYPRECPHHLLLPFPGESEAPPGRSRPASAAASSTPAWPRETRPSGPPRAPRSPPRRPNVVARMATIRKTDHGGGGRAEGAQRRKS